TRPSLLRRRRPGRRRVAPRRRPRPRAPHLRVGRGRPRRRRPAPGPRKDHRMTTVTPLPPVRAGSTRLAGVTTALVTPFRQDGGLDEEALRRLLARQVSAGVSGIAPVGTTGEAPTLTAD